MNLLLLNDINSNRYTRRYFTSDDPIMGKLFKHGDYMYTGANYA